MISGSYDFIPAAARAPEVCDVAIRRTSAGYPASNLETRSESSLESGSEPEGGAKDAVLQVLKEPGKPAASQSYVWVQRGGTDQRALILHDYDASRSGKVPKRLPEGFQGYLQRNGYEGYNAVCSAYGLHPRGGAGRTRGESSTRLWRRNERAGKARSDRQRRARRSRDRRSSRSSTGLSGRSWKSLPMSDIACSPRFRRQGAWKRSSACSPTGLA
jgi:hypothetical protein